MAIKNKDNMMTASEAIDLVYGNQVDLQDQFKEAKDGLDNNHLDKLTANDQELSFSLTATTKDGNQYTTNDVKKLPGKDGKDGINGKDGAPGPKGDKGDQGPQGNTGITSSDVTLITFTFDDGTSQSFQLINSDWKQK